VIWSRRDRRGTLWQVAALPLGGYVRFKGDGDGSSRSDPEALARMSPEERRTSFHGASVGRRMLTVLAGPFFNFLLSVALFAGMALWQGLPAERPVVGEVAALPDVEQPLAVGDVLVAVNGAPVTDFGDLYLRAQEMNPPGPMRVSVERAGETLDLTVPYPLPPKLDMVEPLSPASDAGLKAGDLVLAADGQRLTSFEQLRQVVLASGGRTIPLTVWRDGRTLAMQITPKERDMPSSDGGFERRVMIGAVGAPLYRTATVTPGPITAAGIGVERTWMIVVQSVNGIHAILTGAIGADNLQGPLGIAQASGATASQGLSTFMTWIAIISTAIGFLNLFPIPILDGGHFVAFLIEAVRGRPPSPAAMQVAMSIGLGLILLLMVFATYNDIMRMVS
jgi:regulator of sigma E protease